MSVPPLYIYCCSTNCGFYLATLTDGVPNVAKSLCSGEWISVRDYATYGVVNGFPPAEVVVHAIINSGVGYCTFLAGFGTTATA